MRAMNRILPIFAVMLAVADAVASDINLLDLIGGEAQGASVVRSGRKDRKKRPVKVEREAEPKKVVVEKPVVAAKPVVVERPVTNVVERPVTKVVEKPVIVERAVTNVVERTVTKVVDRPVIVERPVTNVVDRPVFVTNVVLKSVLVELPVTNIVEKPVVLERAVTNVVEKTIVVTNAVPDAASEFSLDDVYGPKLDPEIPRGTNEPARITSRSTYYDRKEGFAVFSGRVHVDDEQYQMHANKAYVFFEGTNDLKRIVAVGGVALTNGTRRAYGGKASYYRQSGMVVLYSDGKVPAEVRDEGENKQQVVKGAKIKFWIDAEQVEVLDARISAPAAGGIGDLKLR